MTSPRAGEPPAPAGEYRRPMCPLFRRDSNNSNSVHISRVWANPGHCASCGCEAPSGLALIRQVIPLRANAIGSI